MANTNTIRRFLTLTLEGTCRRIADAGATLSADEVKGLAVHHGTSSGRVRQELAGGPRWVRFLRG